MTLTFEFTILALFSTHHLVSVYLSRLLKVQIWTPCAANIHRQMDRRGYSYIAFDIEKTRILRKNEEIIHKKVNNFLQLTMNLKQFAV